MTSKTKQSLETIKTPSDWKLLKLEEISQEIYRYPTYYNIEYVEDGIPEMRGELINDNGTLEIEQKKYRFISPNTSSKFSRTILKEGDFVLSVRGTIGKIGIVPKNLEGANITANLIRISPIHSIVFPLFLKYQFLSQSFQGTLNNLSPQTTIKTIQAPLLKGIKIFIPPLKEQQKIASIFSNIDELIEKIEQIIEQTQRLKKGLMQRLLTKGIGHTKFKEENFGGQINEFIPESWIVHKLYDLSIDGTQNGYAVSIDEYGQGIPIVGMTNLFANDILDITNLKEVNITQNLEKFFIKSGDLLFGRRSLNVEGAGKCVFCPEISKSMIFESSIIRLTSNVKKVLPKFLFYMLNSPFGRRMMTRIVQVVAVSGITGSDLKQIKIPISANIKEQKKIIDIISNVDYQINLLNGYKSNFLKIKKGLMQQLLTGRIRVKV